MNNKYKIIAICFTAMFISSCMRATFPLITTEQKIGIAKTLEEKEIHKRLKIYGLPEEDKKIFRQEIINRHPEWSDNIKQNILKCTIQIGMTKNQILASWGKPLHINKTVFKNSVDEQWVYSNRYLYFINDRLDSYQTEEH